VKFPLQSSSVTFSSAVFIEDQVSKLSGNIDINIEY